MEGYYRVAAAVPRVLVGDVVQNVRETQSLYAAAVREQAALAVFPELGLTGYTCADLFFQETLLTAAREGLDELRKATAGETTILVVGAPLRLANRLFNCAIVMQNGQYHGVVPKTCLPNYREYYEKRWFASGIDAERDEIQLADQWVPFGSELLFAAAEHFCLGIELCEDLWQVIPPSSYQALAGATILANLSASTELVSKADYRRELVRNQSARCVAAYVYSSAGVGESTTDVVFAGHAMIAENGIMLAENQRFQPDSMILYADVDALRMQQTRMTETSFPGTPADAMTLVKLDPVSPVRELRRCVDAHPFVPSDPQVRGQRCREIFNIQSTGLAKRLKHTGLPRAVIGISGGLDSTLALLVIGEAMQGLGRDNREILAVTMPGFGTSDRTRANAEKLCQALNADFIEIDIRAACEQHFRDIGHDPNDHSVTFENVQARERTQILMDLANKHDGLVVGTGDLSEMALGWSTYNGDHMSMYAVNCSVPKTLVRYVIQWVADQRAELREVLTDILATPISPELLPNAANGEISQQTEAVLGPYALHDFFLYHMVKYGAAPDRMLRLAGRAFADQYDTATIRRWLRVFLTRFFSQQFKRSCIPDGPKVGTISLSPRGDWRMPSDAICQLWLDRLDSVDE